MRLSRRELLFGSVAFPLLSATKKAADPSPNIVLIVAGDVGSWMLGCYGNKDILTPNIDLLAQAGTRFANHFAYTPASPACRATLFAGRGTGGAFLDDILAAQGYNCGFVGNWGLGEDSTPQHHCTFWHTQLDRMDAKAGEFLDAQTAGKPFFLTISAFNPTEVPRAPNFDEMYAKITFEKMGREPAAPNAAGGKEMLRDVVPSIRRFAAGLTALDSRLPALLSRLQARGVRDNTLIVFCGTNGYLLGRHGLWSDADASDPANMYEETVEVPLIWNWPGRVPPESVRNELVSVLDAVPSLCEVAGAAAPAGRSYADLAFGKPLPKKHPWRNLVFGQYRDTRMARDSRYKLVSRNQGKGPNELYDLSLDPLEKLNRVDNPGFISIRDQLIKQMASG